MLRRCLLVVCVLLIAAEAQATTLQITAGSVTVFNREPANNSVGATFLSWRASAPNVPLCPRRIYGPGVYHTLAARVSLGVASSVCSLYL